MAKSKNKMQYVFIFTFGRSGSTLLMGYLNALPDTCIRGENYMALVHLWEYWKALQKTVSHRSKVSMNATHPWYGTDEINLDKVNVQIRNLFKETVLNPAAGAKRIGFKEIRIQQKDIEAFDQFIDWIMLVFENVKIIFNHRSIEKTAQSGWWKDTPHAYSIIHAMDQRLRNSKHAKHAFHVEYEEFIASPEQAKNLTKFLGADFNEKTWSSIINTRHSY